MTKYVECFGLDYSSARNRSEELRRQGFDAEHFPCVAGEDCEEIHWRIVWTQDQ